jgi:hypothetical protein
MDWGRRLRDDFGVCGRFGWIGICKEGCVRGSYDDVYIVYIMCFIVMIVCLPLALDTLARARPALGLNHVPPGERFL